MYKITIYWSAEKYLDISDIIMYYSMSKNGISGTDFPFPPSCVGGSLSHVDSIIIYKYYTW